MNHHKHGSRGASGGAPWGLALAWMLAALGPLTACEDPGAEPAGNAGSAGGGGATVSESSTQNPTGETLGDDSGTPPLTEPSAALCRPTSTPAWDASACKLKNGEDRSQPENGACCLEPKLQKMAPSCYALCELNRAGLKRGVVWDAYVAKTEDCTVDGKASVCETWNILVDPTAGMAQQIAAREELKKPVSVTVLDTDGEQDVVTSLHGLQVIPWGSATPATLPQSDGSSAAALKAQIGIIPNAASNTFDPSTSAKTRPDGTAMTTEDGSSVYGDNSVDTKAAGGPSLNSSLWTVLKAEGGEKDAYSSGKAYDITKISWSDWGDAYTKKPANRYPAIVAQTASPKDKSGAKSQCVAYVDIEGSKSVTAVDGKSYKVATAAAAIRASISSSKLWDISGQESPSSTSCGPLDKTIDSSPKVTRFPRVITEQQIQTGYKSSTWVDYCAITSAPKATRCGYNEAFENAIYWGALKGMWPWTDPTPTLENFCASTEQRAVTNMNNLLCTLAQSLYYNKPATESEPEKASAAQALLNGVLQGILAASDYSLMNSSQADSVDLKATTFAWKTTNVSSCSAEVRSGLGFQVRKVTPKK